MADYLVTRAIRSFWCTPDQDNQANITPAKISQYGGVYSEIPVMWRRYKLPLNGVRFHVYHIGKVYPQTLGMALPNRFGEWIKVADACRNEELIVDLYNDHGVQMPRHSSWYMVTHDTNLILAVQEHPTIPFNLNTEKLHMRVYANAYFNRDNLDRQREHIDVRGMTVRNSTDILAMQTAYTAAKARMGEVYAFVNGYRVSDIDLFTVKDGDVVEFVYDSSIHTVKDYPVKDLEVFNSTMDRKHKYLIHTPRNTLTGIDYHDDVDFFIIKPDANARFKGVYYHRNKEDAVRQVTHKDYAVAVPYVLAYRSVVPGWDNPDELVIRAHVRKSGYDRPLVHEANRIRELYKLPDAEILPAMIGVNAVVPEWNADFLENSAYTKIMRSQVIEVTPELVQDAYGYNAMSQLLAPSPSFTRSFGGQGLIELPVNLQSRSTVYEFDFEGNLTHYQRHIYGGTYVCQQENTHIAELISGHGLLNIDERYGEPVSTLDPLLDYRMYVCNMENGLPNNKWSDVTHSNLFTIANNQLTWLVNPQLQYTMVRSNRDFLAYDIDLMIQRGVLRFTLTCNQNRDGKFVNTIMQIPLGELDVFLNGKALIEEIDYIVNFPEIVIISKKHMIDPKTTAQKVTVRFTGHATNDMKHEVFEDRGFVQHGVLSNNSRFDIRDDKVLHINVGGAVYDRSELSFAELHSGVNVPGVKDGTPYLIRDLVVPMRGSTKTGTYELRAMAKVTDKHVSDFMSLKLPPPVFTEPLYIERLYQVYSPFVSCLLEDLNSGVMKDERMFGQYNDNVLMEMCKPYEDLLAFEPTLEPHKANRSFVAVHPYYRNTIVELDLFKYRFLMRAVKFYLKDAIELSQFVSISS